MYVCMYVCKYVCMYVCVIPTGRFGLAEQDLSKSLELDPGFSDARLNLEQVQSDLSIGYHFNTTK